MIAGCMFSSMGLLVMLSFVRRGVDCRWQLTCGKAEYMYMFLPPLKGKREPTMEMQLEAISSQQCDRSGKSRQYL